MKSHFDIGKEQFNAGKLKEAVASFTEALKDPRDKVAAQANRGVIKLYLGELDDAYQDLTVAFAECKDPEVCKTIHTHFALFYATKSPEEEDAVSKRMNLEIAEQHARTAKMETLLTSIKSLLYINSQAAVNVSKTASEKENWGPLVDVSNSNKKLFFQILIEKAWGRNSDALFHLHQLLNTDFFIRIASENPAYRECYLFHYVLSLVTDTQLYRLDTEISEIHAFKLKDAFLRMIDYISDKKLNNKIAEQAANGFTLIGKILHASMGNKMRFFGDIVDLRLPKEPQNSPGQLLAESTLKDSTNTFGNPWITNSML